MRKKLPYDLHDTTDFLSDESFQNWVLFGEKDKFWKNWEKQHPELQDQLEEAKKLLLEIKPKERSFSRDQVDIKWSQLKSEITTRSLGERRMRSKRSIWFQYAAIVGFLLVSSVFLMDHLGFFTPEPTIYATGYGQKAEFTLPDGSVVRMNANTRISVPEWDDERSLSIIYGEAFFKIQKTPTAAKPKFTVHTGDMNIAVLGTQFNVKKRKEEVQVMLTEGKINIDLPDNSAYEMKPGEMATYLPGKELELIDATSSKSLGWLRGELSLDNITLEELGDIIQEQYGKKLIIEDPALKTRKLRGSVSDNDLGIVLRVLESSLGVQTIEQQNQIKVY